MSVNGIITNRLKRLAEEVAYLKQERDATPNLHAYQRNQRLKKAVERSLQVAIEVCFDVSQRIISIEGLPPASTYRETFEILHQAGILSSELTLRLKQMVGFRNLIVHDYTRIDDERVYGILKRRLGDFEAFAEEIERYLSGE